MSFSKLNLRRNFGLIIIALLAITLLTPAFLIGKVQAEGGTVYVVICIDTENGDISWYPRHERAKDPNPLFDTRYFKPSNTIISTVFSSSYRTSHVDSFGDSFKMSWFTEMDKQFDAATYRDEGPLHPELTGTHAGYTAIMDTLLRYWASPIQQFGDAIYFHHHVQAWTGTKWAADEDVISCYTHHYDAVNHMIIDRTYYSSVYRAGWLWEDDNINDWLESWIPFDFNQSSGDWAPYHPNVNNPLSSSPPNHNRWMTRSDHWTSKSSANAAFQKAQNEGKAIYSIYFHDREDMVSAINRLQSVLINAASAYPQVNFKYVTALEAIQAYLGYIDQTPPTLNMIKLDPQTYQITSNESVWNNAPYVATKYVAGSEEHYERRSVVQVSPTVWQVTIPKEITITPPTKEYRPVVREENSPAGVTASGEHVGDGDDWPATNAVDNDDNTWWDSAINLPGGGHKGEVPAWIQVDYRSVETAGKLTIHFYDNDVRSYTYGVESSQDGSIWTQIVPAGTVASGTAQHIFSPAVNLRYVKITVTACTASSYAHIKEIRLYEAASAPNTLHLDTIGVATSDISGNPRVLAAPNQAATIESCDSNGARKNQFGPTDTVYVTGSGFSPNTYYDLYVVDDVTAWTEGQALTHVSGTTSSVHADSSGNISTLTVAWNPTLTPGKYDIVVDINKNGQYDSAFDILDENDVEVTSEILCSPRIRARHHSSHRGVLYGRRGPLHPAASAVSVHHVIRRGLRNGESG